MDCLFNHTIWHVLSTVRNIGSRGNTTIRTPMHYSKLLPEILTNYSVAFGVYVSLVGEALERSRP